MKLGTLGDHKSLGEGVYDLRIEFGPGYCVYFGRDSDRFVIQLVCGTSKRQAHDIAATRNRWSGYKQEQQDSNKKP